MKESGYIKRRSMTSTVEMAPLVRMVGSNGNTFLENLNMGDQVEFR